MNSFTAGRASSAYDQKILDLWKTVNGWGWAKFIPLSECFEKFNMPDLPRLEDRVKNNFIYFRTNYLALYVLLLVITGFSAPIFSVVDFCLVFLWLIPFIWVPRPFYIGEFRVTPSVIVAALTGFSVFVLLLFHNYFLHFVGLNLLFILLFRNSSLMSRIHIGLNEKNKLKKYIDYLVCWTSFLFGTFYV